MPRAVRTPLLLPRFRSGAAEVGLWQALASDGTPHWRGAKVVLTARSVPAMEKSWRRSRRQAARPRAALNLTVEEDHIKAFAFAKETYGPVEFIFMNGGTAGLEDNGLKPCTR